MNTYRADLHIHTLLSPCGDLEMSPENIVKEAIHKNLQIIGITDHNTTKHCSLIEKIAARKGIFTLCGAEVTTKEEVHCLAFFENQEMLSLFQQYLDENLPDIKNNPEKFGYQVVVDEEEMIMEEVEKLLISGISQSIDQLAEKIRELNGLFIPAHIDRPKYSLTSQLGFVPPDLMADAYEVSKFSTTEKITKDFPWLKEATFIRSSDAHFPDQLGTHVTIFEMEKPSYEEIKMALHNEQGRRVVPESRE